MAAAQVNGITNGERHQHGAMVARHPDAPEPEAVHLRGVWAIRSDGAVLRNNAVLNKLPGFTYSDRLPAHLSKSAQQAADRAVLVAAGAETNAARALSQAQLIEAEVQRRVDAALAARDQKPTADQQLEVDKFVVDTADRSALFRFAKVRFNVELDNRKSDANLRFQVGSLIAEQKRKDEAESLI
mgnify:CR=1 FL=1